MTSTEPPLAVIASSADLENLAAFTVNFLINSPLPRILIPDFSALTIPASIRTTGLLQHHLQRRSIGQGSQLRIL